MGAEIMNSSGRCVEQQKWGWWEDKASGNIGREQRGEKAAMQESSSPMEADLFSKENMEF